MIATLHPVAAGRRLDVSSALRRDWLALQVAEAYLRLIGRIELTAEFRDEVHLLRPEGRPGPAGAIFDLWRKAARRPDR